MNQRHAIKQANFITPKRVNQPYTINKAFNLDFKSYKPLLKEHNIKSRQEDKFLWVGNVDKSCEWAIHISATPQQFMDLLPAVLPDLKKYNVTFRLIEGQLASYQLNGMNIQGERPGTSLTIFASEDAALILVGNFRSLTQQFSGPIVEKSLRVSKSIYIEKINHLPDGTHKLIKPKRKEAPFVVEKEYRKIWNPLFLVRGNLPVEELTRNEKGSVHKAVLLLKWDWRLLKRGSENAVADQSGRSIRDMLAWQKKVLDELAEKVNAPKVTDFFDYRHSSFLVMEYVEGTMLRNEIKRAYKEGKTWEELPASWKQKLLTYYIQVLDIVQSIHDNGYIHRDITCYNFMIDRKGKMWVIDFELSYCKKREEPKPQFIMGTDGYVALEALHYAVPDYAEDIYSLGALLIHSLTGEPPPSMLTTTMSELRKSLEAAKAPLPLQTVIRECLRENPKQRPPLCNIKFVIQKELETL